MRKIISYLIAFLFITWNISCGNLSRSSIQTNSSEQKQNISFDTSQLEVFALNCSIRAIYPLDQSTLWYAGSRGQYGYTNDGGQTWSIDSLKHPDQPMLEFRSIALTQDCVFLLSIGTPALLYQSKDTGESWNIVYREDDTLAFYDAIAFWDDLNGMAMGDPVEGCLSVIKTIDGGNTWSKITCEHLPETIEGEAAFAASNSNIALAGNSAWMVSGGTRARVFHSLDHGSNWTVYNTPIVEGGRMTGIFSCDFYDEMTGVLIGGDWENQEINHQNKAMTSDGGKTWRLIADGQNPGYRSCIRFMDSSDPRHLIAVGMLGISYSADGGNLWQPLTEDNYYTVRKIGNVLWLAGRNKVARWPLSATSD